MREIKGLWWLPNEENNQISGTLFIEKDKTILDTIGFLGDTSITKHFSGENVLQYDVIWGISSEAKEISIFNCHESMSYNTSSPFPIASYNAQFVAIGKHISSLDEFGNYNVKAYIEELSYWFRPNCLHVDTQEQTQTHYVDLKKANCIVVQIEDDCNLELQGEVNTSFSKSGMKVIIEQMSTLNFVCSKSISIRDALQKTYTFEQFLSFATLIPIQCDRLLLIDKDKAAITNRTIEIYYKKEDKSNDLERFWNYLFVYDSIKQHFSSIIKKWYREKDLFPIRTHLIDSIGHKGSFCSTDFLTTIQAVEGFYCRFRKDNLSLKLILENLSKEFSDISILKISEQDIMRIVDSRHYYSHLLPPGKKTNVVDGHKLYNLNHRLRKLLLCCLLNFVGFSNNEINIIFSKSQNSYLRMTSGEKRTLKQEEPIELKGDILSETLILNPIPE